MKTNTYWSPTVSFRLHAKHQSLTATCAVRKLRHIGVENLTRVGRLGWVQEVIPKVACMISACRPPEHLCRSMSTSVAEPWGW